MGVKYVMPKTLDLKDSFYLWPLKVYADINVHKDIYPDMYNPKQFNRLCVS